LIPNTEVFCGSENKHDRRTAPRQKLFVSVRKLQEQKPQHYKSVLGLTPGKDISSNSKTMQDRRTAQGTKFFVFVRILQELRSQTHNCPKFEFL
jgi:hypothetical protein